MGKLTIVADWMSRFGIGKRDGIFCAFIFAVFTLFNSGKPNIDDYLRLVEAVMIVDHARFDMDPRYLPETGYIFYPAADGKLYTHWGLLSSAIYIPAELLGKVGYWLYPGIRAIEESSERPLLLQRFIITMLILPGIMLANVVLMQGILRKVFAVHDDGLRYALLGLAFLGTQLFRYSSGFEEGFAILLVLAAISIYEHGADTRARGLGIGIIAGLALNARYTSLPIFFLFILFELLRHRRVVRFAAYFLLGFAPYIAIAALYNHIRYESFSPTGFFLFHASLGWNEYDYLVRPQIADMVQYIIDRTVGNKGLLVFSPLLVFALYGIRAVFVHRDMRSPRGQLLVLSGLVVVYYLVFHAVFIQGDFDESAWGPRFLTTAVPFLFILSVPALLKILAGGQGRWTAAPVRGGFAFIAILSLCIQVVSVLGWEETEMYQGQQGNQIAQRAGNLWRMVTDGSPLAPHDAAVDPLFEYSVTTEATNQGGEVVTRNVEVKKLYEGFSLWSVTLGYALGWSAAVAGALVAANLLVVIALGYYAFRGASVREGGVS